MNKRIPEIANGKQNVHKPASASVAKQNVTRVPLEAHIMSKCPDSKYCLENLVLPTMQNVSDKVDFKLSFIGMYVGRV